MKTKILILLAGVSLNGSAFGSQLKLSINLSPGIELTTTEKKLNNSVCLREADGRYLLENMQGEDSVSFRFLEDHLHLFLRVSIQKKIPLAERKAAWLLCQKGYEVSAGWQQRNNAVHAAVLTGQSHAEVVTLILERDMYAINAMNDFKNYIYKLMQPDK